MSAPNHLREKWLVASNLLSMIFQEGTLENHRYKEVIEAVLSPTPKEIKLTLKQQDLLIQISKNKHLDYEIMKDKTTLELKIALIRNRVCTIFPYWKDGLIDHFNLILTEVGENVVRNILTTR